MLTNEMQEVIEEKKMKSKSFEELEFTDDFMFTNMQKIYKTTS